MSGPSAHTLASALALTRYADAPFASNVQVLDEAGVSCRTETNWAIIARELSRVLPGQWWPASNGLTQNLGGKCVYVVDEGHVVACHLARADLARLGVDAPWGVGGTCRAALRWVGAEERYWQGCEGLLEATGWHYQECLPGAYPALAHEDVVSCYYSLLCLLPSPTLSLQGRNVAFRPLGAECSARWRALLDALAAHKLHRNALVGAMAGGKPAGTVKESEPVAAGSALPTSAGRYSFYSGGIAHAAPKRPGPLRAGALLVVRSAWELCALQARWTGAVYANADCVMYPTAPYEPGERDGAGWVTEPLAAGRPASQSPWQSVGLTTRQVSVGEADLRAIGIYRVAGRMTGWYARGARAKLPAPRPSMPAVLYSPSYLPLTL